MNYLKTYFPKICLLLVLIYNTTLTINAQEASNDFTVKSPFHNQLFFNRFLINPTFSLVRENKSYLNVLMRNQYAAYQDNNQNYYLGFSNKLDENTALGLGVYGRWSGVVQEFGFNANYATAVKLGEKSALAFGTNVNYLSQGVAKNRVVTNENDPFIEEVQKENKINIEPGINLTTGSFDFGVFFRDFVSYNQTTDALLTNFNLENINTTLQYTHKFKNGAGIFENGRFMPLVQLGYNDSGDLSYTGSMLLELPKMGWLQTTYDTGYGFSSGIGFNLNKKLSLGYLMEKNLDAIGDNLGWNHELSLAYSFNDELRGLGIDVNIVSSEDERVDEIVRNYEEQLFAMRQDIQNEALIPADENTIAYQNRLVLDELILRQDSIERARDRMLERRFETMVRLLRHEMRQEQKLPKEKVTRRYHETGVAQNSAHITNEKRTTLFDDTMIKGQQSSDLIGIASGYYLIANVFKNKSYLNSFLNQLKKDGIDAGQFYNKENGLYYVYIADFKTKNDAAIAQVNDLNGAYDKDKWIMEVYNPMATADISFD